MPLEAVFLVQTTQWNNDIYIFPVCWNSSPHSGKTCFKFTERAGPQCSEDRKIIANGANRMQKKKYWDLDKRLRTLANY